MRRALTRSLYAALAVTAVLALPAAVTATPAQTPKQATATGTGGAAATVELLATEAAVEALRDGEAVVERERPLDALGSCDERVVDEVECQLEARVAQDHAAGRQAAHPDREGDVPPVVLPRRGGQAHLTDLLRVEVERVLLPRT